MNTVVSRRVRDFRSSRDVRGRRRNARSIIAVTLLQVNTKEIQVIVAGLQAGRAHYWPPSPCTPALLL